MSKSKIDAKLDHTTGYHNNSSNRLPSNTKINEGILNNKKLKNWDSDLHAGATFCGSVVLKSVVDTDVSWVLWQSCIKRLFQGSMLFWTMNVALESLELGWLVFGEATALQSRERNFFDGHN